MPDLDTPAPDRLAEPDGANVIRTRKVVVGLLSFDLVGADIRGVRYAGTELIQRIYFAVRDAEWRTVANYLDSVDADVDANGFRMRARGATRDEKIDVDWTLECEATSRHLSYRVAARACSRFRYRRIGSCVHHPTQSLAGASFLASTGGEQRRGELPHEIAPQPIVDGMYQPLIAPFERLRIQPKGEPGVELAFHPLRYELEDQRNWTDSSFKCYPVDEHPNSGPLLVEQGDEFRASIAIELIGRQASTPRTSGVHAVRRSSADPVEIEIVEPLSPMPALGLDLGLSPVFGTSLETPPVLPPPNHIRVEITEQSGRDQEWLRLAERTALGSEARLELAVLLDHDETIGSSLLAAIAGLRPVRVLIHSTDGRPLGAGQLGGALALLRSAVPRAPVLAGTSSHFSEVNRARPEPGTCDGISWAVRPTVHARDRRSIMENLVALSDTARTARVFWPEGPLAVSTLALPDTADEQVREPFRSAWTVAAVAALAREGVAAITIGGLPNARVTATVPGAIEPIKELLRLRGSRVLGVLVSDPARCAALATRGNTGDSVLVSNLQMIPTTIRMAGMELTIAPYKVAQIDLPAEEVLGS